MTSGPDQKTSSSFLVVALAAILVSSGILSACSRTQTTTSAPAPTTTSAQKPTTTSAPAPTTASAPTRTGVSAADFYKANVVTMVVPYAPGGNTDYAARLFATCWTEATGGRMVIDNKPGAGGMLGANYAYAAKPDGLTMGTAIPGSGLISPVLMSDPAIKYDIKRINWIGHVNPEGYGFTIGAKSPYNSMQDLMKVKGLKFASSGRNSSGSLGAGLVIELFGLQDARIVLGYSGSAEAFLAIAKGEVDAYVTGNSVITDGIVKGFVKKSLVTLDFQRNPYFPDVPVVPELLRLSPQQETLLRTVGASITGQGFWFQPGVPQDRIDFVRGAFDRIVATEGYLKQAKTMWAVSVKPTSGKDFGAQMEETLTFATPQNYNELQKLADKYQ